MELRARTRPCSMIFSAPARSLGSGMFSLMAFFNISNLFVFTMSSSTKSFATSIYLSSIPPILSGESTTSVTNIANLCAGSYFSVPQLRFVKGAPLAGCSLSSPSRIAKCGYCIRAS